jgi:hypothetical protein
VITIGIKIKWSIITFQLQIYLYKNKKASFFEKKFTKNPQARRAAGERARDRAEILLAQAKRLERIARPGPEGLMRPSSYKDAVK